MSAFAEVCYLWGSRYGDGPDLVADDRGLGWRVGWRFNGRKIFLEGKYGREQDAHAAAAALNAAGVVTFEKCLEIGDAAAYRIAAESLAW